jgi:hypothetical protein
MLSAAVLGLLRYQAEVARRAIGKPFGVEAHRSDKTWKKKYGDRLDLLLVGDSIAAGLGAEHRKHTLGAQLARRMARSTRRAVRLRTVAQVGAETSMLRDQLAVLPEAYRPDVAVVVVGGNDVTHRVPVAESARDLAAVVDLIRARGAEVVVGTCPDLGALSAVPRRDRARRARGVTRGRGRAVLHRPAVRDVLGRPVPSLRRRLPADRQGAAAERAVGAAARRGTTLRPRHSPLNRHSGSVRRRSGPEVPTRYLHSPRDIHRLGLAV